MAGKMAVLLGVLAVTLMTVPTAGAHISDDGEGCPDDNDFHYHWDSDNGNIVSGRTCFQAGIPERVCIGNLCICRINCPKLADLLLAGAGSPAARLVGVLA